MQLRNGHWDYALHESENLLFDYGIISVVFQDYSILQKDSCS